MEYDFLPRAGRFLQEQKKHRRWIMLFLCLAAGVTLGTLGLLKLYGQAMTHKVKVLDCKYEVHVHTDECYIEDEDGYDVLVCEHADEAEYVIHVHNDDCYNDEGDLVCLLEEHEPHEHTDACREERKVLVCTLEESEGYEEPAVQTGVSQEPAAQPVQQSAVPVCGQTEHAHDAGCEPEACPLEEHMHSDACRSDGCGLEEHTHEADCYDEAGELICTAEEHVHDTGCEPVTCELEEHTHSSECQPEGYVCGFEAHVHDDNCYEQQSESPEPEAAEETMPAETVQPAGHVHTDDCYEIQSILTCGELELHTHDADPDSEDCCYEPDCFDEEGELIEGSRPSCGLLQLEEHIHMEDEEDRENSCFEILELTDEEVGALNNGATLHVHKDDCYDEDGHLICGYEVSHLHQLDCYDEDGHLICGFGGTPHEHDRNCYDMEGSLICGFRNARDHQHDADCYDEEGNRICSYEGVRDHEHSGACYDEEGALVCGYEGVKDHEHDADCYDIFGALVCGYEGAEDHAHTEDCYDEDGNLVCGREVHTVYEQSKAFECDDYIVVVRYNDDAELPEEAHLLAEQITPELDEEHYTDRETQYQEIMGDENASMKALLKIGFYMEEEEGLREIEPVSPVEVAVQFLDEEGLAEGKAIRIVHFTDDGPQKLEGSDAKDNSTTFTMDSFSEFAFGEVEEDAGQAVMQPLQLNHTFPYEADPFLITFHVEGTPRNMNKELVMVEALEAAESGDVSSLEEGQQTDDGSEEPDADAQEAENGSEESDGPERNTSDDENEDGVTGAADEDAGVLEPGPENGDDADAGSDPLYGDLQFDVESLEGDADIQAALMEYLGESSEVITRRVLYTLSYKMRYKGEELDLTGCRVMAEITLNTGSSETPSEGDAGEGQENESSGGNETAGETSENTEAAKETPGDTETTKETSGDTASTDPSVSDESEFEISVMALEVSEDRQVSKIGSMILGGNNENGVRMVVVLTGNILALTEEAEVNPRFTVQYYAHVGVVATDKNWENTENDADIKSIDMIDTSKEANGGEKAVLPVNGNKELPFRQMKVRATGVFGADKRGMLYEVISSDALEPIYEEGSYRFLEAQELKYFNKYATEDTSYDLKEIWVLRDGKDPESKVEDDWVIYPYSEDLEFTNDAKSAQEKGDRILIKTNTVIRLVADSKEDYAVYPTLFFDYDITDGKVYTKVGENELRKEEDLTEGDRNSDDVLYAKTYRQGINAAENYEEDPGKPLFGFGNMNVETVGQIVSPGKITGLGNATLNGFFINRAEGQNYRSCSFGIVGKELGDDGYPVFNVNAPDLFGEKEQTGKTPVEGYALEFEQQGDTYTLVSVNNGVTNNLNRFWTREGWSGAIWSNDFWPMDTADTFGAEGHDLKFGKSDQKGKRYAVGKDKVDNEDVLISTSFPVSDDEVNDHNCYFGMHFAIDFTLTEDYVGPLNYYFLGDDDMWVFLDKQLVCDIGGVHGSAGEYVDLWDYIPKGTSGKHRLSFFYTERGASGSNCWMQFTLPSVNVVPVKYPSGECENTLTVNKSVAGAQTDQKFEFEVTFRDASGKELINNYDYRIINAGETDPVESGSIHSGGKFYLRDGQSIVIGSLPDGAQYTIRETEYSEYEARVNGTIEPDRTVTGTLDWKEGANVDYVNRALEYNLPETGGPGLKMYTVAGALLMLLGAGFMYKKKFRERRV